MKIVQVETGAGTLADHPGNDLNMITGSIRPTKMITMTKHFTFDGKIYEFFVSNEIHWSFCMWPCIALMFYLLVCASFPITTNDYGHMIISIFITKQSK